MAKYFFFGAEMSTEMTLPGYFLGLFSEVILDNDKVFWGTSKGYFQGKN